MDYDEVRKYGASVKELTEPRIVWKVIDKINGILFF